MARAIENAALVINMSGECVLNLYEHEDLHPRPNKRQHKLEESSNHSSSTQPPTKRSQSLKASGKTAKKALKKQVDGVVELAEAGSSRPKKRRRVIVSKDDGSDDDHNLPIGAYRDPKVRNPAQLMEDQSLEGEHT